MSCAECGSDNVIVSAIKESEDSDGNIIRLYEMNSSNTAVQLKLFGKEIKSDIGHNEVKPLTKTELNWIFIEWKFS